MARSPGNAWLEIGMDAWLLGTEASMVMALRSARFTQGGGTAWREAQRMVAEKSEANLALGFAFFGGQLGATPESVAKGTLAYYRKHVRANRRRLTG